MNVNVSFQLILIDVHNKIINYTKKRTMSNLFKSDIEGRQFNFQPIGVGHEDGYHVDVKDTDGTRWEFTMLHVNEQWHIEAEKLPEWLESLKEKLIAAVEEFN
jgi:hypothetical protein